MGFINGVNLPRNPDAFQISVNKTFDNMAENVRVVDRYCQEVLDRLYDIQPRVKTAEKNTEAALEKNSKTEQAVKKLDEDLQTATRKIDQTNHNVESLRTFTNAALDNRTNLINHTIATKTTQLHGRIDDLETRMDARFNDLETRMNTKFHELDAKVNDGFDKINANLAIIANNLGAQLITDEQRDPRAIHDEARRAADELATRPKRLLVVIESVINVVVSTSRTHSHHLSELVVGSEDVAQPIQPAARSLRPSSHSLHIFMLSLSSLSSIAFHHRSLHRPSTLYNL